MRAFLGLRIRFLQAGFAGLPHPRKDARFQRSVEGFFTIGVYANQTLY